MRRLILACAALLLLAPPALAADISSSGDANNDWSNTATWVGAAVPGNADNVTIVENDTVTVDGAIVRDGTTTLEAGTTLNIDRFFSQKGAWTDAADAAIVIRDSGTLDFGLSDTSTAPITIQSGGAIKAAAADITWTATGLITLAGGKIDATGVGAGWLLDCTAAILATADSEIDWSSGRLTIEGGLNADGHTITHTDAGTDGELVLDVTATFESGTTGHAAAPDVHVDAAGKTVTVGASCAAYGLLLTAGTLDMASLTITVGGNNAGDATDGGCDHNGTVDITNPGTITFAAATAVAEWGESYGTLDFDAAVTLSGAVKCAAVDIGAALDANDQAPSLYPSATNWWVQTAAISDEGVGGASFVVYVYGHRMTGDHANADEIDLGGDGDISFFHRSGGHALTLTGGLTCDDMVFDNGDDTYIVDMNGGNLEVGAIEFQEPNLATLKLGEGDHVFAGTVAREDVGDLGAIDIEASTVRAAEGLDLDGITMDFGNGCLIVTGTGKEVDGTGAGTVTSSGGVIIDDGNAVAVVVKNLDTTDLLIVLNGTLGTGADANGAGVERQVTGGMLNGMGF
jgi:hypothetical protein